MLKKYSKIFVVMAAVLMTMVLMAGCMGGGGGTLKKPVMSDDAVAVEVTGSCDMKMENGIITVSGESDILDGSILYISIEAQNGMTLDAVKVTKLPNEPISHDFVISDDKYDDSVKTITGHISIAPRLYGTHADIVYETYGNKFENIVSEGNLVWDTGGSVVVFASETIDFRK